MISKIERDECSPTAALLGQLSAAFGLTLSQLLARAEPGSGLLAKVGDQAIWQDPETGFLRRALTPRVGPSSRMELVWGELPAGAAIAYPATAFAFIDDQQILGVEGVLRFIQAGIIYDLGPGDCLRLGPPADCRFENLGADPCRYVVAVLASAS